MNTLPELRVVLLGSRSVGKTLLRNSVLGFKEQEDGKRTAHSVARHGFAGSTAITVVDTPGWWKERDREIARGLSLSPAGVHAVLLVVPLDLTFGEAQRAALEERMNLFEAAIWKHAVVLFTYGDHLADESVEEHIEREHGALRWLIDKCEDKYHVVNNAKKTDPGQVIELFEKIEEMVAANDGRLFRPEMGDVYPRIEENFGRRQLKLLRSFLKPNLVINDLFQNLISNLRSFPKTI
uniref:AIG1-type G domain-containing protein n=1 Tax=Cyclopterus lumpus TaxID=8103 RepID=A0A8C2WB26_CYCLU